MLNIPALINRQTGAASFAVNEGSNFNRYLRMQQYRSYQRCFNVDNNPVFTRVILVILNLFRIMKIRLINIGKTDIPWLQQGVSEYASRINHLINFEVNDLKVKKLSGSETPDNLCLREGALIREATENSEMLVLLDENGREFGSREFAGWLEKLMNRGIKEIIFVSGGAFGFSSDIYQKADYRISLSRMTFTHQMVRLVFAEQLYRALTLIKGIPYHND